MAFAVFHSAENGRSTAPRMIRALALATKTTKKTR
jgi:hypothetical protein